MIYNALEMLAQAVREELGRKSELITQINLKQSRKKKTFLALAAACMLIAIIFQTAGPVIVSIVVGTIGLLSRKNIDDELIHKSYNLALQNPDMEIGNIVQTVLSQYPVSEPRKKDSAGGESGFRKRYFILAAVFVLAVLGVIGILNAKKSAPPTRSAEHTFERCSGGVRLVLCGSNYSDAKEIQIPSEYEGIPVVIIGDSAFAGMKMESVLIPDSVTTIESRAFKNCKKLKNVVFGQNVTVINGESFQNCTRLETIEIPLGVTAVRGNTFEGCTSLENIALHDGITEIHAAAFKDCTSIKTIDLPSGITEIRANTFENCKSLTSIDIPDGVIRIKAHAFRNCSSLSKVTCPSTLREIGSSAFRSCKSLRSITIPRRTEINERAFKDTPVRISYN